jgi:serine/threonine protein kinase/Tol biopolymer transport system component
MTPERWRHIERLYHAALERDTGERAAFLAEACDGDEALRGEVESLIRCDTRAERFIESPALEVAAQLCAEDRVQSMTGHQIGPYQILSFLGAGGMGEVHLALDTRLGRKVAIKLLLDEFTTDSERLRRFEQEARAASALNHPNIITVHEIGEIEGRRFIVTEYVEGETLRRRMESAAQRRIRMSEALEIASQVAAALQAAHEAGITHRDIKPENVMLRADGLTKVLDFGLAKLSGRRAGWRPAAESLDTRSGIVMGTVSYMSPEQARGEKVDHRTDIFSLGVTLYEMLAGRRPFDGATASDVMAATLTSEPVSLAETVPEVPATLWRIVERCLEKRPGQRFQSAGDLGFALEALSVSPGARPESQLGAQAPTPAVTENVGAWFVRKRERMAWLATVAALLLGMLVFARTYYTRQPMTNDLRAMKSSILPPEGASFGHVAVSPDGRYLAFTAATGGNVQLWVRAFDSSETRALAGTQDAKLPFWSPDSRFVGFFADGQLKKIEVTGGPVQSLCEATQPTGGAWSRAGVILFGLRKAHGLLRISATGGDGAQVTTLDVSRQELTHRYPTFLPDGRHFLYSIQSGQKETRGVYLGSLDETLKRRLLDDLTAIKYTATFPGDTSGAGWLVFGRDGALLAQPFDTSRLKLTGEPFSLSDKVAGDLFSNYFTFSVSDNGVLVFDPGLNRRLLQYRWVDRRGQPINSLDVVADGSGHWLSPDEKRFIADRVDPQTATSDLWLCDVSGGNASRFTLDPANDFSPVWSPNGSYIIWGSTRDGGVANLYQKAASFAGVDTLLLKSDYPNHPTDWSRDGRFIIYSQNKPKTKQDVWVLPVSGSGEEKPRPVVRSEARETAGTLSPDGRWLAYASDETGRFEIYVQSFPDGGGKRQVSNGGGAGPRWRRDGREFFYYAGDGRLMAAPVRSGENFEIGSAVPLFEFRAGTHLVAIAPYAVTADGQRFLINELVETKPNAPLTVVFNWTAGLTR